ETWRARAAGHGTGEQEEQRVATSHNAGNPSGGEEDSSLLERIPGGAGAKGYLTTRFCEGLAPAAPHPRGHALPHARQRRSHLGLGRGIAAPSNTGSTVNSANSVRDCSTYACPSLHGHCPGAIRTPDGEPEPANDKHPHRTRPAAPDKSGPLTRNTCAFGNPSALSGDYEP